MDSGESAEPAPHCASIAAAGGDQEKKTVGEAAAELQSSVTELFATNIQLTALDIQALAGMNSSATVFYKALRERTEVLNLAAVAAAKHHDDAQKIASDMENVRRRASHLESLVDRLDQYTRRIENSLSH